MFFKNSLRIGSLANLVFGRLGISVDNFFFLLLLLYIHHHNTVDMWITFQKSPKVRQKMTILGCG